MDAPESGTVGEWARYLASAIVGGAVMLVAFVKAWASVKRTAEDAHSASKANTDRLNHTDGRINALERSAAAAEEKFTALLKGHDRIEHKLDRLSERLGG